MKNVMDLTIQIEKDAFDEWIENVRLDELSILVNKVPEQRFSLLKKGRLQKSPDGKIISLVVDGEMATFQEVDGQFEPVFEPVREVIQLNFAELEDGGVEIKGKVREMPRLTEMLEESLKGLLSKIQLAFSVGK